MSGHTWLTRFDGLLQNMQDQVRKQDPQVLKHLRECPVASPHTCNSHPTSPDNVYDAGRRIRIDSSDLDPPRMNTR